MLKYLSSSVDLKIMLYSESLSTEALHNVIQLITDCVRVARNHGGRLFGGFVRGVVVPRMLDPKTKVHYKDVDIWFMSKENADAFIQSMGADLVPVYAGAEVLNETQNIYHFA